MQSLCPPALLVTHVHVAQPNGSFNNTVCQAALDSLFRCFLTAMLTYSSPQDWSLFHHTVRDASERPGQKTSSQRSLGQVSGTRSMRGQSRGSGSPKAVVDAASTGSNPLAARRPSQSKHPMPTDSRCMRAAGICTALVGCCARLVTLRLALHCAGRAMSTIMQMWHHVNEVASLL